MAWTTGTSTDWQDLLSDLKTFAEANGWTTDRYATAADVALMRRVVGADMGVKAAGGVRDLEGMKAMLAAGATRVGASAGVKIVQQARGEHAPPGAPSGY